MAYDTQLENRIREILKNTTHITSKRMFGGVCIMHKGHMLCGITKSKLMIRVGAEQYQAALKLKHAKVMDITGKPLKGFIFVTPTGYKTKAALKKWLLMALNFTKKQPSKEKPSGILRRSRKPGDKNHTPLTQIKNFGPVSRAEYASMGITTLEQIQKLGFEETCRQYVTYYPERLNANAFLGVICSLENTVWTKATSQQRKSAHSMVRLLRQEFGRPRVGKKQINSHR